MATDNSAGIFTDPNALAGIRAGARRQSPQASKDAARQFEAMFVQMMLKSMRATSFDDGPMNARSVGFYRDMFDQQLSLELTAQGSLGIADMIEAQLGGQALPMPGNDFAQQLAVLAGTQAKLAGASRTAGALSSIGSSKMQAVNFEYGASPEAFVQALAPFARDTAEQLGTNPEVLIAQAALETGWGKHIIGGQNNSSHNLFGIKAQGDWSGPSMDVKTLEFRDGLMDSETAAFRVYGDPAQSFSDYAQLISSQPRYKAVLEAGTDNRAWAGALQNAGYATDPRYAEKILAITDRISQMSLKL